MCWACEEEAIWRRYQLAMAVERDEIPPGFEPADFEWAGLPVPSKRAAPTPDESNLGGSLPLIPAQAGIQNGNASTQPSPGGVSAGDTGSPPARGQAGDGASPKHKPAVNPFACDTPDHK